MATESLFCPYCNSAVTLVGPVRTGQRLQCPRCHELFPYRAGEQAAQGENDAQPRGPEEAGNAFDESSETQRPSRPWSNRSVAVVILSIMGLMAAIGLTFAWYTTALRRQRDNLSMTTSPELPRVIAIAPAKLAALGYLPRNTDAIAGIHIAELMGEAETRGILRMMRADTANFGIYRLEQLTGLKLEDLDHAVFGLKIEEMDLPHAFLAVQTRQPYNADLVRANLKVKGSVKRRNKTLYLFPLAETQLNGVLWCAGDRTLVISRQPQDLDDVPDKPATGVDRFPTQVHKCLTDHLSEGTPVWVVGHAGNWDQLLGLLQFAGLAETDRQALASVRTFLAWLQFNRSANGHLEVECADPAAAEEFDQYLVRKGLEAGKLRKLAKNRAEAEPLLQELSQTLARNLKDNRAIVEVQASVENIRGALTLQPVRQAAE